LRSKPSASYDRVTNLAIVDRVLKLLEEQTLRASAVDNIATNEKIDKIIRDIAELNGMVEMLFKMVKELHKGVKNEG
jgi:hypothetical protein